MNSKYTKILLALTICLLMSACSDDIFSGTDYFDNGKVTLRLVVPATTVVNTRANTDETISGNDLYVIEYGDQGSCVAMRKVESSNFSDNTLIINDVNTKTTDIHIVANGDAILASKNKDNMAKLDGVYSDEIPSPPVLWGHINMSDLKSGTNNTVSLLRNVAMATLNKAESIKDEFKITGWEITQTANQGSIAPKDYTDGSTNELAEDKLNKKIGDCEGSNAGEALYLFETPTTVDSRIVIKANEKYYTANFLDKTGSKLPLLRNHHYQITVTATGKGYDSKEDALNAPAGNIKVDIKDYNFKVTNLISNGAYELGTCDTVRVEAGKKTYSGGEAYFVTMWGNDVNAENIKPSLSDPTVKWLKDVSKDTGTPISSTYSSAGKGYKLTFTCDKNPSEEIRRTTLTVTFGVLKRDIVIVQQGSNLKKARTTMIYGLNGDFKKGQDYIEFSKEVKGISRAAMGGTSERDNGLQLGIGRENNYHYTIKKVTGDKISQVEGAFEVDDKTNGDYYTIKAKNQNDESVWTGRFTITTQEGYKIIYDIYHTGIFWEDKAAYQPASNRTNTTGWYYYELIKSEKGVWMLDRNLGARSVDDPGGYYRIKESDDRASAMADICPPGFSIPTASLWKQLTPEMKLVTRTTSNGTTYQSVELPAATTAQSKNIRFPRGGMNNGYEVTNPSIGYYWSATIVSGNQGFDFNSPEYGYWYNVARLSSGSKSMISVRYVGGSNLTNTGVYKYLNTRCVKSSSAVLDKNRLTIHDKRKSDKPLYIYIHTENDEYRNRRYGEMIRSKSDGSETTIYYDMIAPDRIMESIGKPLYIRFRQGDDLVDSGWIGEKKLVGNQREFTVE